MAASTFAIILRRLRIEMGWLGAEFRHAATSKRTRHAQLAGEMAVIRLHDSWARCCKEIVILSALGNVSTLGGVRISRSLPATVNRVLIIQILLNLSKSRYEPKWARPRDCIAAATKLSVYNLNTISAAIGATNSPAEEVRVVRNFYAHRGQYTFSQASNTGFFGVPPTVFDLNAYTSGGNTDRKSVV